MGEGLKKSCLYCIHRDVCKYRDVLTMSSDKKQEAIFAPLVAEQCKHHEPKCLPPKGITIKPDGKNELDFCTYKTIERHVGCTVEVDTCTRCGHTEISWYGGEPVEIDD